MCQLSQQRVLRLHIVGLISPLKLFINAQFGHNLHYVLLHLIHLVIGASAGLQLSIDCLSNGHSRWLWLKDALRLFRALITDHHGTVDVDYISAVFEW